MGNSEGQPTPDCYLQFGVDSFPTESNNNRGVARYVSSDTGREPDTFMYRYDSARDVFIGWLAVQSGELQMNTNNELGLTEFEMTSVCVEDLIVGMNVKFFHEGACTEHFALQTNEEFAEVYDMFAPACTCRIAELNDVRF